MDATVIAQLANVAAAAPVVSAPPSVGLGADDLAAARFSEMMNARAVEDTESNVEAKRARAETTVQGADTGNAAGQQGQPKSFGDAILDGVSNLSSSYQEAWRTVGTVVDGNKPVVMGDMLRLQLTLVQMAIQYEMVGKAISRSTQNIDQLVKMQ
jgi:type III secretion protein I